MGTASVWKRIAGVDTLKILPQSTKPKDIKRDRSRKARLPGQRISKTGKIYWEERGNRSDRSRSNL